MPETSQFQHFPVSVERPQPDGSLTEPGLISLAFSPLQNHSVLLGKETGSRLNVNPSDLLPVPHEALPIDGLTFQTRIF